MCNHYRLDQAAFTAQLTWVVSLIYVLKITSVIAGTELAFIIKIWNFLALDFRTEWLHPIHLLGPIVVILICYL